MRDVAANGDAYRLVDNGEVRFVIGNKMVTIEDAPESVDRAKTVGNDLKRKVPGADGFKDGAHHGRKAVLGVKTK